MPDDTSSTPQNEPTQEPTQGDAQQPTQSQPPADQGGESHGDPDAAIDWKEFPADWDERTILRACAQAVQLPGVTASIGNPKELSKDTTISVDGVSLLVRVSLVRGYW